MKVANLRLLHHVVPDVTTERTWNADTTTTSWPSTEAWASR